MAKTTKKLYREYNDDGTLLVKKECRFCNSIKPIDNFYKKGTVSRTNVDGYENKCIPCHKVRWHEQAANPENRKRWLLERIRSKCIKGNIPFNLTIDDLVIPPHCPILGMALKFGVKTETMFREKRGVTVPADSPSVDRIHPDLGYVRGNIVIISYRANMLKNDATIEEMEALVGFYRQFKV
jgi:hypothetical protein